MRPVLYAEDEPDDVYFMKYAWEGARVANPLVHVKDGQAAIDYLAGEGAFADRDEHPLPCLLLLDLKLPAKSGFEVLEWIRKHPTLASLRVVIVSGSNQESDMERARGLGVLDYVVKPSNLSLLVSIVREKKGVWLPAE